MKIGVSITRKIVVDSKVNTLDINTSTKNVSGDTNTLVKFFELLVPLNAILILIYNSKKRKGECTVLPGLHQSAPQWTENYTLEVVCPTL
jgi:hypothetical protein